ncbi:hypothetical protein [Aliarcobacter thereius]|jgi:hypothetical protein|uniref:hypothetical protein n=1 Tax=Aliarcobacter thereius TaxID=544718 RepID=UPI000826E2F6|nr:hypothetical protein [Aliarcobacter thereius]OCL93694.1 hypothetical protein AAX25_00013 [Aliarcobacter thereius]
MNIELFINKFNVDKKFKLDLLSYAEEIKESRTSRNLKEHKDSLSSLESNLLLTLISNEVYSIKKGINIK